MFGRGVVKTPHLLCMKNPPVFSAYGVSHLSTGYDPYYQENFRLLLPGKIAAIVEMRREAWHCSSFPKPPLPEKPLAAMIGT
jgi:hypothetical protein